MKITKSNLIKAVFFNIIFFQSIPHAFTLALPNPGMLGWDRRPLSININATNCPSNISLAPIVDSAAQTWNTVPTSNMTVRTGGPATSTIGQLTSEVTYDTPVITCSSNFQADTGLDANSSSAAAYVTLSGNKIVHGYILLNVQTGSQGHISNLNPSRLVIIIAHEIGHILGLGHSDDSKALMYFDVSAKTKSTLARDDMDGVTYLYQRNEPPDGIFGCGLIKNQTPKFTPLWLLLILFPLFVNFYLRNIQIMNLNMLFFILTMFALPAHGFNSNDLWKKVKETKYSIEMKKIFNEWELGKLAFKKNEESFLIQPIPTPGNDTYIGLYAKILIPAKLTTVIEVLKDTLNYINVYEDIHDIKLLEAKDDDTQLHWAFKGPMGTKTKYQTVQRIKLINNTKAVLIYGFAESEDLSAADGIILLQEKNNKTELISFDFFDADWGMLAKLFKSEIWKESCISNSKTNFTIRDLSAHIERGEKKTNYIKKFSAPDLNKAKQYCHKTVDRANQKTFETLILDILDSNINKK
ncbi:MAG: matrixin family metalloprotease [Oligoflexia bacterium]|nr:matrixin family metalloprotease [Oligoflexia bacterium]